MILYFIFLDSVIAAKKKKVMTTEDFLRPKEDIFDALTTFHTLQIHDYERNRFASHFQDN